MYTPYQSSSIWKPELPYSWNLMGNANMKTMLFFCPCLSDDIAQRGLIMHNWNEINTPEFNVTHKYFSGKWPNNIALSNLFHPSLDVKYFYSFLIKSPFSVKPRSNDLSFSPNNTQHLVTICCMLLYVVLMWSGQTCRTFCETSMTRELSKVWRAVKRDEQHTTSLKSKEMFFRTTFVVKTYLISSKLHTIRDNNT